MRKKIVSLVVVVGVVVGLFFVVRLVLSFQTPKSGVLKITTNIPTRVYLDNRELGKTPFEEKVDVGEYTLRLAPTESTNTISSWQGNVVIRGNIITFINRTMSESELTSAGETLSLEKIGSTKAELTVTSIPDGQVVVDNELKGMTPITLTDLSAGDHNLAVNSPGFDPRTVKIRLTAGYKLTASLFLALSPSQMLSVGLPDEELATPAGSPLAANTPKPTAKISGTPTPSPTKSVTPTKAPTPSGTQVAIPEKVTIQDTPTGFLRVRKEPTTSAQEIGRAKPGEVYAVLDAKQVGKTVWYKITFSETEDGWISGEYAK
jgi:hypothetical protein